jgi:hypothetical protein
VREANDEAERGGLASDDRASLASAPCAGPERLVLRSADPLLAGRVLSGEGGRRLLVPSDAAAQALGLRRAPDTLRRLVLRAARDHGRVAPSIVRRQALRSACASVFGYEAAAGYAGRGAAAVTAFLRAGLPAEAPALLGDRLQRWWRVAHRYRQELRQRGAIDPAEAWLLAAQGSARPAPLALVGYAAFERDEVLALDALAGPGSVVLLPRHASWTAAADAAAAALLARGWQGVERDDPAPDAAVSAWRAPTLDAEVRAALAYVKGLLVEHGLRADEIVVTCRALERYAEPLRSVAREYGVPLRVERRVPLRRTSLGAWLVALIEVLADDFPFESGAALLRHPFCGLLDQAAFDAVRAWRPRGLAAWRRALARSRETERVAATLAALAPFTPARRRRRDGRVPSDGAGWREALRELLQHALTPAAQAAFEPELLAWTRALDDGVARAAAMDRAGLLRVLRDVLRALQVPEAGPPAAPDAAPVAAAVRVVPPETLTGARVPEVLALGVAEGLFPERVVDPPLFDAFDRAELRAAGFPVPTAADEARRERLVAWGVWRAAGRLWLSYPEQAGRDALLPSALFAQLGAQPAPIARGRPASPSERRARDLARTEAPDDGDSALHGARHAWRVECARERSAQRDAFDGVVARPFDPDGWRWSASQLTTFGQCRFRWLAESAWGVREPREGEVEVSPLLRGSLYHQVLHRSLAAAVGLRGEAARAAAASALEAAFADAEERSGATAVLHWEHLRAEHLGFLRGLLDHPAFLPDDHEVVLLERHFEGVWHGLRVSGRVDRIDRTPAGLVVTDYKSGAGRPLGARGFDPDRLELDLQLPLYLEVAAPVLLPGEDVAGARYFSLLALREIPREAHDPAETADFVTRLRRTLAAGDYPVEPSAACSYCALAAACRKGPRLERKRATAEAAAQGRGAAP